MSDGESIVDGMLPAPLQISQGRGARSYGALLCSDAQDPESFRQVFASLDLPYDTDTVVIGVTSAIRGEGRTSIALGLAGALAADLDTRVSLVELDLERPYLARYFGRPAGPGVAEVARGMQSLPQVAMSVSSNLSLVSAGWVGKDSSRLLHRLATENPFRGPSGLQGVVVLDLPPIIGRAYGALAADVADATVLVVRAGVTPIKVVQTAIATLERAPQGVILNAFRSSLPKWLHDHVG